MPPTFVYVLPQSIGYPTIASYCRMLNSITSSTLSDNPSLPSQSQGEHPLEEAQHLGIGIVRPLIRHEMARLWDNGDLGLTKIVV